MTPLDFSPGAVIGRSFAVWRRSVLSFSAVVLAVHSPAIVLAAVWDWASGGKDRSPALGPLSYLLALVAIGALTGGALRAVRGAHARAGEMLVVGLRRVWVVLCVMVFGQLALMLGFALLVLPGIALVAGLWVAVPAAVAERWTGTSDALTRSWDLTRGRRWKVLAVALASIAVAAGFDVVGLIALEAVAAWGASHPVVAGLEEAVVALAIGFLAVAAAVSYHDLRVAREGVDDAELAIVFE